MNDRDIKTMEWFAVGDDGTSVLRVVPGLALGESATGALALNDADPECRWVAFAADSAGTWLEASDRVVMTGEDGVPLTGAFMKQGMVLRLPNNDLYISRDIRRPGRPGPVLAVAPLDTADRNEAGSAGVDEDREVAPEGRTLPRGAEVLDAIDDLREQLGIGPPPEFRGGRAAPAPAEAAPSTANPDEPAPSPVAPDEPTQLPHWERAVGPPPTAAVGPGPAMPPPRDPPPRRRPRRGWDGGVLAAAAALLMVGVVALPLWAPEVAERIRRTVAEGEVPATANPGQPSAGPVEDVAVIIPRVPPPPIDRGQPTDPDRTQAGNNVGKTDEVHASPQEPPRFEVNTVPIDSQVPVSIPDDEPSAESTEATDGIGAEPTADAAADAQDTANAAVEERLARARELLYEGNVTYPPDNNAVDILADVLAGEPDHPGARLLLEECSQRLIKTARRLHESGLHYEARNTLEEVLSFDPDSARARSLLQSWVASRS